MIKNKKLALLSVAGLLGVLAVGVTAAGSSGTIRTFGDDATIWKHYAAVAATETDHGSKEFWACCTPGDDNKYGKRVFTAAEVTGKIEEGGDIKDTTYWNDIVEGDDRYVAPLDSTITFDARGGTVVTEGKYSYGTLASALPTTTRAADDYYESYDFGGWYKDGVAYDKVAGSTTVKANWKYGDAKKEYITNNWGADYFTDKGSGVTFRNVAFINAQNDVKNGTLAAFDKTDDEGVVVTMGAESLTTPAIDFKTSLDQHHEIYMYVGGYNSNNQLTVAAASNVSFQKNDGSNNSTAALTKTLLRFTKDASGSVHMHYMLANLDNPMNSTGRQYDGDVLLTDDQANGKTGLTFTANLAGTRAYWIGKPYAIKGEAQYLDVIKKNGFTVTGADVSTKAEHTSGNGALFLREAVYSAEDFVVLYGNSSTSSAELKFDAIKLSDFFDEGKGIKFTVGAWNGNEAVYFGETSLGVNAANYSGLDPYTQADIEKTFHNWVITIDDIGFHAYNQNEDKTYDVPLTAGQIAGTESISLQLTTKLSNGRCFLLSDLCTYHF